MKPRVKKTIRLLAGLVLALASLALAGYFIALPLVQGKLQTALREGGMPEARVELGLDDFLIQNGEVPLARVSMNLWDWLTSGGNDLVLSDLTLDCAALPQNSAEAKSEVKLPAIPWLNLPFRTLKVEKLSIDCQGAHYASTDVKILRSEDMYELSTAGSIDYKGMPYGISIKAQLRRNADYNLYIAIDEGQLTGSLKLEARTGVPLISGELKMPVLSLPADISATDINLTINKGEVQGWNLPVTAQALINTKEVTASGALDLQRQTAKLSAKGDIFHPPVEVTAAEVKLEMSALWPPVVKSGASFRALAAQMGGLPLVTPSATFSYSDSRLKVAALQAGLFGGTARLSPFATSLPPRKVGFTATLTQLDLGQVLKLAAVSGLEGRGEVGGMVPVSYDQGKITFAEAELKAVNTGNISYQPNPMPAFLAEGGQGALLGQAFSDFDYNSLTLQIGGTLGDNLTLKTRLEGRNKSFYDGHLVAFNLNLSGALESLLTEGLKSFQFSPEDLKKLVEKGSTP